MKKRLLIVSSTYPRWENDPEPGFVHELAKRLVCEFDITVLCPHAAGAKPIQELDSVKIVRYRYAPEFLENLVNKGGIVNNLKKAPLKYLLLPSFFLSQLYITWRLVHKDKPDIIHAHWLVPQGLVVAIINVIKKSMPPFLVTSHGADLFGLRSSIMMAIKRFVARRAALMTVVSKAMYDKAVRLGIKAEKLEIRPMGVDLNKRFYPDASLRRSRDEILFVGRLVEKKGLRYLIDAMPVILHRFPSAHLTIAGFGPEESVLKNQAIDLQIEDKITFLGGVKQSDLPTLYRRAAVFVAPFVEAESGDQEGLGLVVVEALGCGCPVVVSDIPAARDVTEIVKDVRVVPPANIDLLTSAICETLGDQNIQRNLKRRDEYLTLLKKKFDWDSVAEGYSDALTKLIRA